MTKAGEAVLRYGLLALSADDVEWVLRGRSVPSCGIVLRKDSRTGELRIGLDPSGRGLFRRPVGNRSRYQCRSTTMTRRLWNMGFRDGTYEVRRVRAGRRGTCERTLSLRRTA